MFETIKKLFFNWLIGAKSITIREFHTMNNPESCAIDDATGNLKFIQTASPDSYLVKTPSRIFNS